MARDKPKKKKQRRVKRRRPTAKPKIKRVQAAELTSVVARARELGLSAEDCNNLDAAVETLQYLFSELDRKRLTLARLRSLFGLKASEKSRDVLEQADVPEAAPGANAGDADSAALPSDAETEDTGAKADSAEEAVGSQPETPDADNAETEKPSEADPEPKKGHGRNGVKDYEGAETIDVSHPSLSPRDECPACPTGRVYEQRPRVLLRVEGQAPIKATCYELQTLRCNLCGKLFIAKPPDGVGEAKYEATSAAMIGVLKYGSGLPFNRLEKLEGFLGVPLPASTQWEIVRDAGQTITPVYEELIYQAAQGEVLHSDDTSARILDLLKENKELKSDPKARTGIFTTGFVVLLGALRVALFFTGRKHAGENAEEVLAKRATELGPPILMSDALDRNVPQTAEVIEANCLAHGRRKFVDAIPSFPDECRYVLETIGSVYKNDADTKSLSLSPDDRLAFHVEHSKPLMEDLEKWLEQQLADKLVEPNSSLGMSIAYMLNHWEPLTLFLREPGAPLDNNICERGLKKAILHRRNSLFYKTLNGAKIGDVFMSLIYTTEICGGNPFDYLTQLLSHPDDVAKTPWNWLPWTYQTTLKALG